MVKNLNTNWTSNAFTDNWILKFTIKSIKMNEWPVLHMLDAQLTAIAYAQ